MNGLLLLVLFGVVTLVTVAAAKKSPVQPKAKVKDEPEVTEESEAIKRMKELKEQGFEDLENLPDDLSPEEVKKRLGKIVNKSDTNKDKFITRDELVQWFLKKSASEDEDETKVLFKQYDINKDGNIEWTEYTKDTNKNKEMLAMYEGDLDDNIDTMLEEKVKFDAADINKNGMLNRKEFDAFLHAYNFKYMHNVAVDLTLREKDMNNNGFIDLKEYMMFANFADHDNPDEAARKVFDKYDLNRDEKLNRSEIRAWAVPTRHESANDGTNTLMSETDANSDGKLTRNEILVKDQLWVDTLAWEQIYGLTGHDPQEL